MADQGSKVTKLLSSSQSAVKSKFRQNIDALSRFGDIHLIVGYASSVILPIIGFVGSCILVRYKGDYTNCLVEKHYIRLNPNVLTSAADYEGQLSATELMKLNKWVDSQKEDRMRFWLRIHESLTFAYSISFFFFIQRGSKDMQALNAILYTILLIAFVVFGLWSLISHGGSECTSTAYGKMTLTFGIINMILGLLMLVVHLGLYALFAKKKRLPDWLVGSDQSATGQSQVQPMSSANAADGEDGNTNLLNASAQLDPITNITTKAQYVDEISSAVNLLVVLFISSAAPESQQIATEFATLQENSQVKNKAELAYVNADTNQETCQHAQVTQFPAVLFYKGGNLADTKFNPTLQVIFDTISEQTDGQ